MMSRTSKQLTIGAIYSLIFAGIISSSIYFSTSRPTCFDAIQNGKEEGVDCGTLACGQACAAAVQSLVIQSVELAQTPVGDVDVAAEVYNPNSEFGASQAEYQLTLIDATGAEVLRKLGSFYMLPGQTKQVIVSSLRGLPAGVGKNLEITSVIWEKVSGDPSVLFGVTREALTPVSGATVYEAVVTNNSNFDFDTVDVNFIVRDVAGALLTTSTTNLQTFISHTERSVKATWPFALPADARVQVEVGTNVFTDANFLKSNGTLEKFQRYY